VFRSKTECGSSIDEEEMCSSEALNKQGTLLKICSWSVSSVLLCASKQHAEYIISNTKYPFCLTANTIIGCGGEGTGIPSNVINVNARDSIKSAILSFDHKKIVSRLFAAHGGITMLPNGAKYCTDPAHLHLLRSENSIADDDSHDRPTTETADINDMLDSQQDHLITDHLNSQSNQYSSTSNLCSQIENHHLQSQGNPMNTKTSSSLPSNPSSSNQVSPDAFKGSQLLKVSNYNHSHQEDSQDHNKSEDLLRKTDSYHSHHDTNFESQPSLNYDEPLGKSDIQSDEKQPQTNSAADTYAQKSSLNSSLTTQQQPPSLDDPQSNATQPQTDSAANTYTQKSSLSSLTTLQQPTSLDDPHSNATQPQDNSAANTWTQQSPLDFSLTTQQQPTSLDDAHSQHAPSGQPPSCNTHPQTQESDSRNIIQNVDQSSVAAAISSEAHKMNYKQSRKGITEESKKKKVAYKGYYQ